MMVMAKWKRLFSLAREWAWHIPRHHKIDNCQLHPDNNTMTLKGGGDERWYHRCHRSYVAVRDYEAEREIRQLRLEPLR